MAAYFVKVEIVCNDLALDYLSKFEKLDINFRYLSERFFRIGVIYLYAVFFLDLVEYIKSSAAPHSFKRIGRVRYMAQFHKNKFRYYYRGLP